MPAETVLYECDYCGGLTLTGEEYDKITSAYMPGGRPKTYSFYSIGSPAIQGRPTLNTKICAWCFQDSFEKNLKKLK